MKRLSFLFLLITLRLSAANNLVVGFLDPNEVITLSNSSNSYDTILLVNNGTLNIENGCTIIINELLAVFGRSELNVNNSTLEINKLLFLKDSAIVNIHDSLTLKGHLYLLDTSTLFIDSATVNIPMSYKSQYGWWGLGNSTLSISNSDFDLGTGALEGTFANNNTFIQNNCNYHSSMLPMTIGLVGNSTIIVDSCTGGMEFVIAESPDIKITHSETFMIWYTFSNGDTVNFDFPTPNSIINPLGSAISSKYIFSDSLSGIKGVDYRIEIANTDPVFWGIISKDSSTVTVNNSLVLACGFYFDGNINTTASNFINNQNYTSYNADFLDRSFSLNNSSVLAWNFYPSDSTIITIDSSTYGESLGFGGSITKINNSICDGTGGYFGGMDSSITIVYKSTIERTGGSAQILNFQKESESYFYESEIIGDIVLSGSAEMYFFNTTKTSTPIVNDNAFFTEVWMHIPDTFYPHSEIPVEISFSVINGPHNTDSISGYELFIYAPDGDSILYTFDDSLSSFPNDTHFLMWDNPISDEGKYLFGLQLFINNELKTEAIFTQSFLLQYPLNIEKNYLPTFKVYPKPAKNQLWIETSNTNLNAEIELFNSFGQLCLKQFLKQGIPLDVSTLKNGMYYLKIESKSVVSTEKILINR